MDSIKPKEWDELTLSEKKEGCLGLVILAVIVFVLFKFVGCSDKPNTIEEATANLIEAKQEGRTQDWELVEEYRAFSDIKPDDAVYKENLELAIHSKKMHDQFSLYDGSNIHLVAAVKAAMNDPDSFEHVSTTRPTYSELTINIQMQYRGKNAFGGKVLGAVEAELDADGTILNIKEVE